MHIGFQIGNILESVAAENKSTIDGAYLCHNSVFDLFLSYCNISLDSYDPNNKKFLENNSIISTWNANDLIKQYSVHIVNNPLAYLKNNNSLFFHLNTILFAHDIGLLSIKKEDSFLLCNNAFRKHDTLIYFPSIMANYSCPKITKIKLEYSIPDAIHNTNKDKNGIAIFSYNKNVSPELLNNIDPNAAQLSSLPSSLEDLNTILNSYKILIEFDPASVINALSAVACGAISIVLDTNNLLTEYKNIPNLYIVNSIAELKNVLLENPSVSSETTLFDSRFRNFDQFTDKISKIIKESQRKAFVL